MTIYCIKCQLDYFVPNALAKSVILKKIPGHLTKRSKRTGAACLIESPRLKKDLLTSPGYVER